MRACDQPALGWTVVMRRRPVRLVDGRVQGGYTNVFELICCDCGDHPDLDYREVSPDFSGSAGRTRSRRAWRPMRSTSDVTTGGRPG